MTWWLIKSDCSQLLLHISASTCSRMNKCTSQILHKCSLNCRSPQGQICCASAQKRWLKPAALRAGFQLPSLRESDFYWPTNVASRSRTGVNQYKWRGSSSLPFRIHELLGHKATAEPDPCGKRFWSLFSANRHLWMLSNGWQGPGCIIFEDYNGLVSPHKERKCQCGDIVPLFNTVEIKSLSWIYPLIYAYPSEETGKDTGARGEEGDGFVTFGFLCICWWTLPVTLQVRNKI